MNVIDPVSNLLVSTIATAPDPAATGTSFVVTTGEGALFPDPSTDGEYNLIIYPPDVQITRANSTMVRVTSRTTDTFTVTRDTESSNPRDVVVGDKVAMVISAKMFTDIDTALGTIPTDVADLADSTGVIPIDVSDLSDSTDLIKEDVSELTDTTGLISGKLDKTTNVTAISDTAIADGEIAVFSLSNQDIETSNVTIATTVGADDTTVPTSLAVATLVNSKLFTWQGSWATPTAYALYDAVENDGSSYVCTSAHISGSTTEPGVGGDWVNKWDLFVEGIGGNSIQVDCSGGTGDTYGALSGLVNSSNAVYTVSLGSYVSGSLRVYLNGQLQTQGSGEDWVETTPASGTFTFATAPTTGDIIIAMYQFTTGSTGNADTLDGMHLAGLLNWFYPVGTIYETTSTDLDTITKMGTHFGGTWEAYGSGRVLVAKSSDTEFDTIGETGGAKTHTLTEAQIPSHSHKSLNAQWTNMNLAAGGGIYGFSADGAGSPQMLKDIGSGESHNNLQPYIVVFRYRRTA